MCSAFFAFQIKEALDYLSFLPPKSAEGFLKAIQVWAHANS